MTKTTTAAPQQTKAPASSPQRVAARPTQSFSNQSIGRLLGSYAIQAKLVIGSANDRYEAEADRVADSVLRMPKGSPSVLKSISRLPASPVQRKCSSCDEEKLQRKETGDSLFMQRKCAKCEADELQRKSDGSVGARSVRPSIEASIQGARGGGQPLPTSLRRDLEPRFGTDLSGVRVHNDTRAAELSAAVGAHAFTTRQEIFFGAGEYRPDTQAGRRLLAHELAHTVQQGGIASVLLQRDGNGKEIPQPEVSLGWGDKALIGTFSGPTYAFGGSIHDMVDATATGFIKQIRGELSTKEEAFAEKVKANLTASGIASFVLHYWWGLVKGIFSPITGLIDLAKLAVQLSFLPAKIASTAWEHRNELAADATELGKGMFSLSERAGVFLAGLRKHPIDTVKALYNWFSSLGPDAIKAAEKGGRSAGHELMAQFDKPLSELGEIAGEIIGTILINLVLLVFTDGIGNAITQVARGIGELGSVLGKFGKAAEVLGAVVGKIGTVLEVLGGWIAKAEAGIAKVAETVLKPIAPVLEEFGKLVSGLRAFLRKLLGVSEEAAVTAGEQALGGAASHLNEPKPPASLPDAKPGVPPKALGPAKPTVSRPPVPPTVKPAAGNLFENLSEETESLLAQRPGLRKVLEEHPEAARLLKICKSPCKFPSFLSGEKVAETLRNIERLKASATRWGEPLSRTDEAELKALLNRQTNVEEFDKAFAEWADNFGRTRITPKQAAGGHLGAEDRPALGNNKSPGGKPQPEKAELGNFAHSQFAEIMQQDPEVMARIIKETGTLQIFDKPLPNGMIAEYRVGHPFLEKPNMRIDRLWREGGTIYEIKPLSGSNWASRGPVQGQQYAEWLERHGELAPGGKPWKVETIGYYPDRLKTFLQGIGYLPK